MSKNVKDIFFVNVWCKNIFDIYVTEYGTALTTILPILFLYLNTVIVTAGGLAPYDLIQPTISLEMPVPSQGHYVFTVFRLLTDLSVYIIMSFDFPFVRLFGVR